MTALPEQLAVPVRERLSLNRRVSAINASGRGWRVSAEDGAAVHAREVVIATDDSRGAVDRGAPAPTAASSPTGGPLTGRGTVRPCSGWTAVPAGRGPSSTPR